VCTIDPGKFMFGTTLVHLLLEISVLLLPVFQVASLRLRPGQKFAVVAMFMFGILYVLFHILLSSLLRYLCTSLANSFL
jgi:predicted membrane protein